MKRMYIHPDSNIKFPDFPFFDSPEFLNKVDSDLTTIGVNTSVQYIYGRKYLCGRYIGTAEGNKINCGNTDIPRNREVELVFFINADEPLKAISTHSMCAHLLLLTNGLSAAATMN